MSEVAETPTEPVVYQRSRLGRLSLFFKAALGCLLLQGVAAGLVWGALGAWIYGGAGPDWLHPLGIALVLAMIPATWALCNLSEPTQLILYEDHLRIGGAIIKRKVRYDDVRLLRLEELDEFITRSLRLVIKPRRSDTRKVVLLKDDATECFHALRQMCPQAAAIEFDHAAHAPVDEEHAEEGRKVLSAELFRKALRSTFASVGLGLFGGLLLFAAIGSGSIAQQPIRSLFAFGLPLAGAMGFGLDAIRCWRLRAIVRRERFVIVECDDEDDEADDVEVDHERRFESDQTAAGTP